MLRKIFIAFIFFCSSIFTLQAQELQAQERQVAHYEAAITDLYLQLDDLSSNPERLEKFAREHYFMKRENEDLFRILPTEGAAN